MTELLAMARERRMSALTALATQRTPHKRPVLSLLEKPEDIAEPLFEKFEQFETRLAAE